MARIVLIGGGARSGKSRFALKYATHLGARRLFVATAVAGDEEMRGRIDRHRRERGDGFVTREEPLALVEALSEAASFDVVVIDCLTLWLSNLLLESMPEAAIERRIEELVGVLKEAEPDVVLVTNEVGLGIVPEHALARRFRDLAGRAHQELAEVADEVYLGAMGCLLRLKPPPVTTMERERWH